MCMGSNDQWIQQVHKPHFPTRKPTRTRVRILRLARRKQREEGIINNNGKEMELKNMKLYMENIIILQENEKLRKKANLLHQENLALISQFQKIFS
ncbi:hypothetical protein ABFS83_05G093700 [Erythranthe nasuta]